VIEHDEVMKDSEAFDENEEDPYFNENFFKDAPKEKDPSYGNIRKYQISTQVKNLSYSYYNNIKVLIKYIYSKP